jgi:hypothetical protein
MPLPDGFPFVDAAAFIMTYATSHHALLDRGQLQAGETVLVLGAAGGVGPGFCARRTSYLPGWRWGPPLSIVKRLWRAA